MCMQPLFVRQNENTQQVIVECATVTLKYSTASLTNFKILLAGRRMVEWQAEGDDGRHNKDDERRILHRLPRQAQEALGGFGGDDVRAIHFFPPVKVGSIGRWQSYTDTNLQIKWNACFLQVQLVMEICIYSSLHSSETCI